MDLAQRSTSVSGLTSSSTYHTIDRFATELGLEGGKASKEARPAETDNFPRLEVRAGSPDVQLPA